jgi:hypothetical protein
MNIPNSCFTKATPPCLHFMIKLLLQLAAGIQVYAWKGLNEVDFDCVLSKLW